MDASLVFTDSKERGTTCAICHVHIQDKTPSSKARHVKTKMHQIAIQSALSDLSNTYLKHKSKRNIVIAENVESHYTL